MPAYMYTKWSQYLYYSNKSINSQSCNCMYVCMYGVYTYAAAVWEMCECMGIDSKGVVTGNRRESCAAQSNVSAHPQL